jgi:hypothetical protein
MWKAIFQNKLTIYLQSKFTIIRPKNYKKSLLCGLISQTSAEMPPKNVKHIWYNEMSINVNFELEQ